MSTLKLSELIENKPVKIEVNGREICVVKQGVHVFAFDDTCSHSEASLSESEVSLGRIECWLHGAEFDMRTGEALTPPAIAPLAIYKVKIEGDLISIDT